MIKKFLKEVILVVIFSVISAVLSYLANSSLIFDKMILHGFLSENVNIPLIQDYCLWIGIVLSALFLSLNLIITKFQYDRVLEERNSLIKMNKDILSSSLGKRFLSDSSNFDIRIFIPKHLWLYKIADKLHIDKISKKFAIKNIDLIANQGVTKDLEFEVSPETEGLVGICYQTKAMVYDDNLEKTNNEIYKLNQNQIARTTSLKWSICCPVCDESNSVIAIIALDGKTKITINKEKEAALRDELLAFSRMLADSVPQLFKR